MRWVLFAAVVLGAGGLMPSQAAADACDVVNSTETCLERELERLEECLQVLAELPLPPGLEACLVHEA